MSGLAWPSLHRASCTACLPVRGMKARLAVFATLIVLSVSISVPLRFQVIPSAECVAYPSDMYDIGENGKPWSKTLIDDALELCKRHDVSCHGIQRYVPKSGCGDLCGRAFLCAEPLDKPGVLAANADWQVYDFEHHLLPPVEEQPTPLVQAGNPLSYLDCEGEGFHEDWVQASHNKNIILPGPG
eukprot:TRINITY_DN26849_c0_g1_i4.p1 TRINITY_DN26849_c0_g1~~TRINITY_DN26849_c0_g1_i4.p1  ORF type:complete len:210 (-),score=11.68 TRINITY_DN26849_c0_g1_i4:8-562(-)